MTDTNIDQIVVDGERPEFAQSRLDYVRGVINRRLAALAEVEPGDPLMPPPRYIGPALRVDAGNVPDLLADRACAEYLGHIADHGARTGVVLVLHAGAAEAAYAIAATGTATAGVLAAALVEGRHVRLATQ